MSLQVSFLNKERFLPESLNKFSKPNVKPTFIAAFYQYLSMSACTKPMHPHSDTSEEGLCKSNTHSNEDITVQRDA